MASYSLRHGITIEKENIVVSHINIRQSISILIIKLIAVDIFSAFIIGLVFVTVNVAETSLRLGIDPLVSTFGFFFIMAFLKLILSAYIILDWLNEYYELTPKSLIYRRGIIFVREEHVNFSDVRKMVLIQGLFGRILNFGTIEIYDFLMKKTMNIFLIHNPIRYEKILLDLIPEVEEEKFVVREKVFEKE